MKVALVMAVIDVTLDIGTDMLIISLSFCLLWKVRIKPRQKFFLGVFLSLNIFIAIIAYVRVSGLEINATFDEIWLFVWQQIEACVAVAMLSGTAFRSVFVSSTSARAGRDEGRTPWYSSTVEKIRSRKKQRSSDEEGVLGWPSIPSATLTGMRTFINGGRQTNDMNAISRADSVDEAESVEWQQHMTAGSTRMRQERNSNAQTGTR